MLEHNGAKMTYSKSESRYGFTLIPIANPTREPLHEAFANLQEEPLAIERFIKRWAPMFPMYTIDVFSELIKAPWGLTYREDLRKAWRGEQKDAPIVREAFHLQGASMVKITKKRVEIEIYEPYAASALLFMHDFLTGNTAICGNPECNNKYFIKKRATQKFCEAGGCVVYAQRQYALKWWNAKGKKWRARRKKEQRRTA